MKPKYLCPMWGATFFKGINTDLTLGNDLIDFINWHSGVLNRHKMAQTVKTNMLRKELGNKNKGFLRGFIRGLRIK